MIWAIVIIAFAVIVALLDYSIARSRMAAADRRMEEAHQGYLLRYQGGKHACVVCELETRYSLRGKPMHPGCRRDVA